jgi:TPR repeat protein
MIYFHILFVCLLGWLGAAYASESPSSMPLNIPINDTEILTGKILYNNLTKQESVSNVTINAEQQYQLGLELKHVGLYEQVFPLFLNAAHAGNADAQTDLAYSYYHGYGIAEDHQQAAYWYEEAAKQGVAYSQFRLCVLYDDGDGVIQDKEQARYWCSRAALQGNSMAKAMLAVL